MSHEHECRIVEIWRDGMVQIERRCNYSEALTEPFEGDPAMRGKYVEVLRLGDA